MPLMKPLMILLVSLVLVALPEAAQADRRIRIIHRSSDHDGHDYHRDHPVVRPRYGLDIDRREVIIVNPLQIGPFPGAAPYPIAVPPVPASPQSGSPRLLHGQEIYPLHAQVYGRDRPEGREGPGTVYSILTRFTPGQWVTLTQVAGGADGYDWYLAASPAGQYAWVRGDALVIYVDED